MATNYNFPQAGNKAWKEPVANAAALPLNNNNLGDCRIDISTQIPYVWTGTAWEAASAAAIIPSSISGDKTFTDDVFVNGALQIGSNVIKTNDGGDDTTAEDGGLIVEGAGGSELASLRVDVANKQWNLKADTSTFGINQSLLTADSPNFAGLTIDNIPVSTLVGQVVRVSADGTAEFTSIQAAYDSIIDSSINKRYILQIYPGIYNEVVTLSPTKYISLQGVSAGTGEVRITGNTTLLLGSVPVDAFTAITGINFLLTPTTDNQCCMALTAGTYGIQDCFFDVVADTNITGCIIDITTATLATMFSCSGSYNNTFATTKDGSGFNLSGSGQYFMGAVSIRAVSNAASGHFCVWNLNCTGEFFSQSCGASYFNTNAAFSGETHLCCVESASALRRNFVGGDFRAVGAGSGTAIGFHLDSDGSAAEMQYADMVLTISGFTPGQEHVTSTAAGDTQKVWLNATNKDLSKIGAGESIVTPYDEFKSGIVSWGTVAGTPDYWDYNTGTKVFTVTRRGVGVVRGSPVVWEAGQTTTALADKATNFVYMNSSGIIGHTTTANEALYNNNIVLFEVWVDGTNVVVVREDHPLKFTSAISGAWHRLFGTLLQEATSVLGISGAASARQVSFTGDNVLTDHGLDVNIPTTATVPWNIVYTNASGKATLQASATALPGQYNNAGTPTNVTNNSFVVFRLAVGKNSLKSATPTWFAIMDTTEVGSLAAANNRIAAGTVAAFPTEINQLEVAQIGYAIVRGDGAGAGTLQPLVTALKVFGAQFLGSSPASSATLITTTTTSFDGILGTTDTTVQQCLETIDNFGKAPNFKMPVLTTAQRTALTPNEGTLVGDSDLSQAFVYLGATWRALN